MKSDISRFGEKLVLRDAEPRQATAKAEQVRVQSHSASSPEVGYKLPFRIDSRPFLTKEGSRNDDIPGKATTFCRACPQYGHALIFPRKCYYEAQCPLPLLFCIDHHGEKAVKSNLVSRRMAAHPTQNFLRRLSSPISKILDKILDKSAYRDPAREMTSSGWRKRA